MIYLYFNFCVKTVIEDSCETTWKTAETNQTRLSATEIDHSYSLDLKKAKLSPDLEPVAKKRLVFSSKSSNKLALCNSSDTLVSVALPLTPVVRNTNTVLRVMGEGNVPQPITNGGVYKALKVGNDFHFIRIEHS